MRVQTAVRMALLSVPVLLSGCATFHKANSTVEHNLATIHQYHRPAPFSPVQVVNTPYLLGKVVPISHVNALHGLPKSLADRDILVGTGRPLTLDQISALISHETGVAVRADEQAPSKTAGLVLPSLPGQKTGDTLAIPQISGSRHTMAIHFQGRVVNLLNEVGSHFGMVWHYAHGAITFSRFETVVFHLPQAFPGTMNVTDSVGTSGNNQSSSSGGTGQSDNIQTTSNSMVSMNQKGSIWDEMEKSIKSVVGKSGSYSAAPYLGVLVVRTTPNRMTEIRKLVDVSKAILNGQVALHIQVYAITVNHQDEYGLNLQGAFQNWLTAQGAKYGLALTSGQQLAAIGGTSASALAFNVSGNSTFAGSQAIVQALDTMGKVSTKYNNTVIVQNGQAFPVANTTTVGYPASVTSTVAANVGTSTATQPGSVTYGYSMSVMPRIINARHIEVQINLNISNLVNIQQIDNGGNLTEYPTVQNEPFLERTRLSTGKTIMLMGFEQTLANDTHNGVGNSHFWVLGGSATGQIQKQLLVVFVTPEIEGTK